MAARFYAVVSCGYVFSVTASPASRERHLLPVDVKKKEARQSPRAKLTQPVRIRPFDSHYPTEVCNTLNVARKGFYFITAAAHYFKGMGVHVIRNFQPDDPLFHEEVGDIVRIEKLPDGKWGIAVRILRGRF
jgi:hypothetical protein